MNFIEPSVQEIIQEPDFQGVIKHIDKCAGICYNRLDAHATSDEQTQFVNRLIQRNHGRPLEFGTIYLQFDDESELVPDMFLSEYNVIHSGEVDHVMNYYVTTNYRYLLDNKLEFALAYLCEPTELHAKRKTILLNISRALADEFRTHITLSSLMLSTRYANYNSFAVMKPHWFDKGTEKQRDNYTYALNTAQNYYNTLIQNGLPKQDARGILPLDAMTKLVLCGFVNCKSSGWDRFLAMRTNTAAHPDAIKVANMIKNIITPYEDEDK